MKENYLKNIKQRKENQTPRGITLVALVITVIILLILAGVAISMITGGDGLFAKANNAATKYNESVENEKEVMDWLMEKANEYSSIISAVVVSDRDYNSFSVTVNTNSKVSIKSYKYYLGTTENYDEMQEIYTHEISETTDNYKYTNLESGREYYAYVEIETTDAKTYQSSIIKTSTWGNTIVDKYDYTITLLSGVTIEKDSNTGDCYLYFDGSDSAYATLSTLDANVDFASGFTINFDVFWDSFNFYSRIVSFGDADSEVNRIGVGNFETSSTLFASVFNGTSENMQTITNYFPTSVRKNYSLQYIKTGDNTYKVIINNLTDNISSTLAESISLVVNNTLRGKNYIGYSGFNNNSKFHGRIYSLSLTTADKEIFNFDFTELLK